MSGVPPVSDENDQNQPVAPEAKPEKAGFKAAAPAEPVTEGADPMAAQEAIVDEAAAENLEQSQAAPVETVAAAPLEIAPLDTGAAPLSDELVLGQDDQDAARQLVQNAECLTAIATLFGREDLFCSEYLKDLTVLAQTSDGLLVQSTDNLYTVAKEIVQAEEDTVTAKAAFEMSLLAMNNPSFDKNGIDLTGNLRDRYMLTLAAQHTGLNITNPVAESDIPAALKADFAAVKAEWDALVQNPPGGPDVGYETVAAEETAPVTADAEAEPSLTEAHAAASAVPESEEQPRQTIARGTETDADDLGPALADAMAERGEPRQGFLRRFIPRGLRP